MDSLDRDPYLPPTDWKPKSQFFKTIMEKARYKVTHKEVLIPCQHCGENMIIRIAVDDQGTP